MRKTSWLLITLLLLSLVPFQASATTAITAGQYVKFGKYNDSDIIWRCLAVDDNGYLMISDKILTLKSFDAAGTKANDPDGVRALRGSDSWSESSLRKWLNSSETVVSYEEGHVPNAENVKDGVNEYDAEKGFLHNDNFTTIERSFIKPVSMATAIGRVDLDKAESGSALHKYITPIGSTASNYENAYKSTTTDMVFLPDVTHIEAMKADETTFGTEYFLAKPTMSSLQKAEVIYKEMGIYKNYFYWLRDPVAFARGDNVRTVYNVSDYFTVSEIAVDDKLFSGTPVVTSFDAYNGGVGVRPMLYLDSTIVGADTGSGTAADPYTLAASATYVMLTEPQTANIGRITSLGYTSVNAPEGATYMLYHNGGEVASFDEILIEQESNTFKVVMYDGETEVCSDELTINATYVVESEAVRGSVWYDGSMAEVVITAAAIEEPASEMVVLMRSSSGEIVRNEFTLTGDTVKIFVTAEDFVDTSATIDSIFVWRLKKMVPFCTAITKQ